MASRKIWMYIPPRSPRRLPVEEQAFIQNRCESFLSQTLAPDEALNEKAFVKLFIALSRQSLLPLACAGTGLMERDVAHGLQGLFA